MSTFGKSEAVAHSLSTCTPPRLASSPPHVTTGARTFSLGLKTIFVSRRGFFSSSTQTVSEIFSLLRTLGRFPQPWPQPQLRWDPTDFWIPRCAAAPLEKKRKREKLTPRREWTLWICYSDMLLVSYSKD